MQSTRTQFETLGPLAREVVVLDRFLAHRRRRFFRSIASHDGKVLSLCRAREVRWPMPSERRAFLSRALAKACGNGLNHPEGGPPNAAAMAA